MTDNHGYVFSPLPVAPVNETDRVLLPDGLNAFKKEAKQIGLDRRDASVTLNPGFDATLHSHVHVQAGMIPTITENPRHRKRSKRGRKRLCNASTHALKTRVEAAKTSW
jgi:hypothetical protein